MANQYVALREKHQAEFDSFPVHFAFGDAQIEQKCKELKLSKDPKKRSKQIVPIGAGGFVLAADYPAYLEMCKRHAREREEAIAEGEKGGTYLYDMFRYELANHEFGYTGTLGDTLRAVGLTRSDIEARPALKTALESAARGILDAI